MNELIHFKTKLLVNGLNCDFKKIKENFKNLDKYKVNFIKISDRHFITPKHENRNFIPDELILSDGHKKSVVKVYYVPKAKLVLTAQNKQLIIKNISGTIWPIKIEMVPRPKYYNETYKNLRLNEFVSIVGVDRVSIIPFDGCEHWFTGRPCKFCGGNPSRLGFNDNKPNIGQVNKIGVYEHWWNINSNFVKKHIAKSLERMLKLSPPKPHFHLMVMSGSLSGSFEWKIIFDCLPTIKKLVDLENIDSYLINMPPKDFREIDKAKKAGFKNICYNLECYSKKYFQIVCPGKTKLVGYERAIKALEYSVKVFGKGHVRTNFVLGAEPISETLKGVKKLAKKGIVSDYSVFFPRPGSEWSRRKPPKEKEIINFTQELIKTYRKYGYHPFACRLSSRSSIASEVFEDESSND